MNIPEAYDYYEVLGVRPDASVSRIKKAYRKAAVKWHPDVNSAPEAGEMMKLVNAARDVLLDPAKRREYDETRKSGRRVRTERPEPQPNGRPNSRPWEERQGDRAYNEQQRRRRRAWEEARTNRESTYAETADGPEVPGAVWAFVGVAAIVIVIVIAAASADGGGGGSVQRGSSFTQPVTSGFTNQTRQNSGGGGGSFGFNQPPRPTGIESIDRINQLNFQNQQRMFGGSNSAPSTNPFGNTGGFGNSGSFGGSSGGSFGGGSFGGGSSGGSFGGGSFGGGSSGGSFGGSSGGFSGGGGSFGGGSFGGGGFGGFGR